MLIFVYPFLQELTRQKTAKSYQNGVKNTPKTDLQKNIFASLQVSTSILQVLIFIISERYSDICKFVGKSKKSETI